MFLVNDTGIIKTVECTHNRVVSQVHDETVRRSICALHCRMYDTLSVSQLEGDKSSKIEQLRLDLQSVLARADQELAITAQKEEQIQVIQATLE